MWWRVTDGSYRLLQSLSTHFTGRLRRKWRTVRTSQQIEYLWSLDCWFLYFLRFSRVCVFLRVCRHLCIAGPGGRGPSAGVCRTGRWWDGCRCGRRRCGGLSPDPGPSSPSRWAGRSARSCASWPPEEGAAEWRRTGIKIRRRNRIYFSVYAQISKQRANWPITLQ